VGMDAAGVFAPLPAAPADHATARGGAGNAWRIVAPVPADAPPVRLRHRDLGEPVATWTYRDAAGAVLGYVCRFRRAGGGKEIRVRTLWTDAEGRRCWRWASWPVPRPLYGVDRLAAQPDALVIACEGERAADAAADRWPDCAAVTSPGGARAAAKTDWSPLADRRVTVWPDRDDPGADYARTVARLAGAAGATEVRVVDVPADWPDGWDLADALPDGVAVEVLQALLDGAAPIEDIATADGEQPQPDGVRRPYVMRADGLYRLAQDADGVPTLHRVCAPLYVRALTRSEHGEDWGRHLAWADPDGTAHEWAMPAELLAGDGAAIRAELWRRGLQIQPGVRESRWLSEYLATAAPGARARCVTRCGWHGGVYVLPDVTYPATADGERVLLQTVHAVELAARTSGTLDEWRVEVAALCIGNSRLALGLCVGLAAPLLALTDDESGGVHLHGASATGKTTALRVAGSVWGGGGAHGWLRTWRATANGLESVAAAHCDGLLCLDELGQAPARDVGEAVYMLAHGQAKARARGDGTARRALAWRVLMLSSGEVTLGDKMRDAGLRSRAGQAVRLVEIPADAGGGLGVFERLHGHADGAALARHLRDATARLYGVATREYLARLAADRDGIAAAVTEGRRRWVREHCAPGADGQVERVADRMGLLAAAGELATALGILPWPDGEASRAAAVCFGAWLGARGGTGPAELAAGIEQVRLYIARHGSSRFERHGGETVHDRAGWVRGGGDAGDELEYLILPEMWRAEVCAGHDAGAIAAALAEAGHLRRGGDGKPQRPERLPGAVKPKRVYVLRASILGEGGADE
jgi:putative DNA primase/helicase